MTAKAIKPEPRMAVTPRETLSPPRKVEIALMMISGAADPNAKNEAEATSSRRLNRRERVSRETTSLWSVDVCVCVCVWCVFVCVCVCVRFAIIL